MTTRDNRSARSPACVTAHRVPRGSIVDRGYRPPLERNRRDRLMPKLSASPFAPLLDFDRRLFLLGTPAVDHVNAKAPFAAHPKPRQLPGAQQTIHSRWMHSQIFGKFPNGQNLWRQALRSRFFRRRFFHNFHLLWDLMQQVSTKR